MLSLPKKSNRRPTAIVRSLGKYYSLYLTGLADPRARSAAFCGTFKKDRAMPRLTQYLRDLNRSPRREYTHFSLRRQIPPKARLSITIVKVDMRQDRRRCVCLLR